MKSMLGAAAGACSAAASTATAAGNAAGSAASAAVDGVADMTADVAKEQCKKCIEATCGEGSSAAMTQVTKIVEKVYADLFPDKSTYPLALDLSLILRQAIQDKRYAKPLMSGISYDEPSVFKRAARYALFANAVYKTTKEDVAERIQNLSADCIRHFEQCETVNCPNFLIAEDPITDCVVIAIRGTKTVSDALTDCLCEEVPFLRGKAHKAIAENARNLIRIAKPILKEILNQSPKKRITVTGHSLGAGTAVLTTLELFSEDSAERIHEPSLVECFAFAPPPVFFPAEALPSSPVVYSFVNNMDCIPRTCLGTGIKLMLAVKEVDGLEMSLTDRLKFIGSPSVPQEPKMPDFREIPDELQSKFNHHCHAGTVILLYPDDNGEIQSEKLERQHMDRLLIHPKMASDHSMGNYCTLLNQIVLKHAASSASIGCSRPAILLDRLPKDRLKEVASALKVLEDAGLSEISDVQALRTSVENKTGE